MIIDLISSPICINSLHVATLPEVASYIAMCCTVRESHRVIDNINDITMAQLSYCDWFSWTQTIGSSNREARGPWHLINLI